MADIIVRPVSDSSTTITVSKGFIGPPGRAATIAVGTVTSGASASVTNVGNLSDAIFDFVLPKGDKGDAATIQVGTVSALNPDQTPTVTNSGTTAAAVLDFGIPDAASVTVGTISTINPDQNPTVVNTGSDGNVVLDFDLPRAADVTAGTVTVVNPNISPSVSETITNGDTAINFSLPRSATITVEPVTVLNPNQNPSVADTGTNGDSVITFSLPRASTFTVGTVTTGTPESSASVSNVGTNGDVVLDFSIPQGVDGDTGIEISDTAPANTDILWADTSEPGENVLPNGGTTDQYLVKVSNSDFDTAWETLTGSRVSYDNTNSDLTATLVQTAIDELDAKKLNISALTSSVKFFPTTAAGAVSGYGRLVTDTGDADYDNPAVAVTVGPFTGTGQLLGSLVSDAGVLDGNTTPINVTTIGNVRRSSGNTNDVADFYFEVYKRDSGGTETLIGTSSTTASVTVDTFEEFFADCLIQDTLFTATDRVVIKFYGNVLAGGGGETYEFQYGGNQPVRTLFPVPVTVVPDVKTASDIQVDASGFTGLLSGTDDDVQTALDTLDGVTKSDIGLGNVDNTSDADKPVSTATQSALDDKADKTTQVIAGTGLDGGGDLSANRTFNLDSATIASLGLADTALQSGDPATDIAYSNTTSGLSATDVQNAIDEIVVNGLLRRFRYIATQGQTTFTGSDSNGNTLDYYVGQADVYVNGVRIDQSDFTATTGTSIVLNQGLDADDELVVLSFGVYSVADINAVDVDYSNVTSGLSATTVQAAIDELAVRPSDVIASFTWDSATTSPAASVARTVPQSVLTNLYDNIRGCTLLDDGSVNYYLNASDWSTKAGGGASDLTGADGQVMVEIPAFYYRVSRQGTETTWEISYLPLSGFSLHPAFILDGVQVSHRYYGAYDACVYDDSASAYISGLNLDDATSLVNTGTDKLASVKGIYPMVGLTRNEFRLLAANRGTGWRQLDFPLWCAVGMLYVVEYQTFYSQDELGAGNTNGSYVGSSSNQSDSPHTIAGAGDAWGNASTDGTQPSAGAKPGTAYMKYRGIENQFGNCWNWADAINVNVSATGNVHIADDNDRANYADNTATNHTLVTSSLTTGSANISDFLPVDPYFLAESTGGTSAQYVTDRHFGSASSSRVVLLGGGANSGGSAGVFALDAANSSGLRFRSIGGRLCR